ncbi:MAG: hypothetical protein K1X67_26845 [Fimbriimonadaceae bacterium]|nr:hypothetical protein [Fimbriimonadaceae bacterium]
MPISNVPPRISRNAVTLDQIDAACRHVGELIALGMTENLAIRNLELFANVYAKLRIVGNASPDHFDQFELWSLAARRLQAEANGRPTGRSLRCEHGTPRRQFARLVLQAWERGEFSREWLDALCDERWKVAVITIEEDTRLNRIARTKLFASPEERWKAAAIDFGDLAS